MFSIALFAMASALSPLANTGVDVIPEPARIELHEGAFVFDGHTSLLAPADARASKAADFLESLLRASGGPAIARVRKASQAEGTRAIVFQLQPPQQGTVLDSIAAQSYTMDVSADRVVLSARDPQGLLYAAVSLWQLCTADSAGSAPVTIHAMHISDAPRFAWRGLLLDSARHYQSPEFIRHLLDWMAVHKLNVLQWHLTDDQAWRLQIRKYPRLTEIGAWRVPAGAGAAADLDPVTGRPRLYGGSYSQEVVRQIVAHAADRNVTIVPEIDIPGHATAAIVAYPSLASTPRPPVAVPSDWGIYTNLYNAEPQTLEFLENVLAEVIELFPSRYVHVGGDEAVKDQWQASPGIQQRMHELGIANVEALQGYFVQRMGRFLRAHGRRLIGWDEILDTGIDPDVAITSWRGIDGAVRAASQGHDAVLSPSPTLYLDHRQGDYPDEQPGRGLVVSLEQVYRFDPLPAALPAEQRGHILGLQANIWTEHIRTERRVEFMTFPRAAAVAEVGWSPASKLSWPGFLARLPRQMRRYEALGIHPADDVYAVQVESQLDRARGHVHLRLHNQAQTAQIRYTLDGREPDQGANLYTRALDLPLGGELMAAAFAQGRRVSAVARRSLSLASLQRRTTHELRSCTDKLVLSLEDDAPVAGNRAVFRVDVMSPCWIYPDADLSQVSAIAARVGQVPFNFQLGADVHAIKLRAPQSAAGELEVRLDNCEGPRIAALPLQPASGNPAVTALPAADIGRHPGVHDLCFTFTQRSLDPLWVIDSVQLVE